MNMKKIIYMFLAAAMFVLAGCKEKDEVQHNIVGEWYYSDQESGQDIEIFVAFNIDRTFDLYQKIGEGYPRHLTGTYEVDRTLVSGMYSDRTPWASDYNVSFVDGNMIMTSTTVEGYSVRYLKKRIPDEIRDLAVDMTKSGNSEEALPFL
jgi:hypothetical protein